MSWVTRILGLEQAKPASHAASLPAPDLSRIAPYSYALQEKQPFSRGAYTSHFHKGEKHLVYVAAAHEVGPENATFQNVRAAMALAQPECVIVEGLETARGISPQFYKQHVAQRAANHFHNTAEPEYTAHLAMQKNIPFQGGEPTDEDIFKQMQQKGYSQKDCVAFYLARSIPHMVEREGLNAENFDAKAKDYLDHLRFYKEQNIPPQERLSVGEFKAWYAEHNNAPGRSYLEVNSQNFAPLRDENAAYFNRMSADMGDVRERHLDALITEKLKQYNRVMVVYGSGHLAQSRAVFEGMFGKADNVQLGAPDAVGAGRGQ